MPNTRNSMRMTKKNMFGMMMMMMMIITNQPP
jgi:hypothetical protein